MKRILSALLCVALLLGLCICSPAVSAADTDSTAAQAVKAPVIDGEIDKIWDTTPQLDGVVCDMGPDWTMEDLLDMDMATGYTKVLWAEDALYFLAVVYDKTMESDASSTTNGINFCVSVSSMPTVYSSHFRERVPNFTLIFPTP